MVEKLKQKALDVCSTIFNDYEEAELSMVPKSMFLAWKIGKKLSKENTKQTVETPNAKICCLGSNHKCILNVNDGYCMAITCQYQVLENEL